MVVRGAAQPVFGFFDEDERPCKCAELTGQIRGGQDAGDSDAVLIANEDESAVGSVSNGTSATMSLNAPSVKAGRVVNPYALRLRREMQRLSSLDRQHIHQARSNSGYGNPTIAAIADLQQKPAGASRPRCTGREVGRPNPGAGIILRQSEPQQVDIVEGVTHDGQRATVVLAEPRDG
ncbi:hypothetical protein IU483_30680 [Streptomyces gardneri]|nr:hypothetical protein [Streptomyces gardneri]